MPKLDFPPSEFFYTAPVVLVSCLDKKTDKPNVITIAWCGVVCSNPPLLSISIRPSRYSNGLIKNTGDFVVNVPSHDIIERTDLCGVKSGRDADKFKLCKFTAIPSSKVASPMIKECPVNMECRLKDTISLGTHDMFIGEVVATHADRDMVSGGKIDSKKIKPFIYSQGEYLDMGKKIGYYGFSSK